ncbi:MAG: DUF4982 domain-containing protein [Candidatus Symbiothrix sp.]|jgi:beta-galactosidase|nr:DUF4982 domain-containing protein [Candidatus Symbiothrix sp.]
MKQTFLLVIVWLSASVCFAEKPRKTIALENDWRFQIGEVKDGEKNNFDDSAWEIVSVPHDWAIGQQFDMNIDRQTVQVLEDGDRQPQLRTGRTGALPMFGVAWYRKNFEPDVNDSGKQIFLEFQGAMSNPQVFVNGRKAGEWHYGYTSFIVDITEYCVFGKPNVLAVRLDNPEESSRFYTGAGLFRPANLIIKNKVHIAHWGTYITTPQVSAQKGELRIQTTIENNSLKNAKIQLVTEIISPDGKIVGKTTTSQNLPAASKLIEQKTSIAKPERWSIEHPRTYKAISRIYAGKVLLDEYETIFGFREIRFDAQKGFFLNGENIKLKGVCLHHDLGPLGAAVNRRATERQLQFMKEMGCNAIRTAHNPPSLELLNLCDSLGFVVIDEAFDEWQSGKMTNGYNRYFDECYERDLTALIHRDRNHPCVILWSIGNEIREQRQVGGYLVARRLTEICHREDPTRLVTAAFDQYPAAIDNQLSDEIDVVGFNYKFFAYEPVHEKHPQYILYGSETASTVSSRGVYKFPLKWDKHAWHSNYQVSSYATDCVPWGCFPDEEFAKQDDLDFVFGEFVWTGFDYLGEPTPYNEGTPARSSYFGIVDLAGLKKDIFYLYQSHWSDRPVLHLLPHWNWEGYEGKNIPVMCYTNYPKVELFVNGKSYDIQTHDPSNTFTRYRLIWDNVPYSPGELKAVAYNEKGEPVQTEIIQTAGKATQIRLTADRTTIAADGKDLSFITAEVLDKDGNPCPTADSYLFFEVEGAGKLKSLCNGDATGQIPFSSNYMPLFSGKLVAAVQSSLQSGEIKIRALGGLLKASEIVINSL